MDKVYNGMISKDEEELYKALNEDIPSIIEKYGNGEITIEELIAKFAQATSIIAQMIVDIKLNR